MGKGSARTLQHWLDKGYTGEEAEKMRMSRIPGTIEYFHIFKKMPLSEAKKAKEEYQSKRAVTLENMIRKYGDVEGEIRWQEYKDKQAYTNSFEYKKEKYGWSYEQWDEYNKSRGQNNEYNSNQFNNNIREEWKRREDEKYYRKLFDKKKKKYGWSEDDWEDYLRSEDKNSGRFNPLTDGQYYIGWVNEYGKEKADKMELKYRMRRSDSKTGFEFSDESRKKMRKSFIDYLNKRLEKDGQVAPMYNVDSISIIEEYGKENGYDFQHAENGGEYFIEELGYWVDGYDEDKNVVFEYDERYHFDDDGNYTNRDIRREKEIGNFLKCKFIRVDYKGNVKITNYEN